VTLVIDASVIVKWLLRDPARETATAQATELMAAVMGAQVQVLQPFHWLAEVAAVLSRLSPATAVDDILLVQALGLPTTDDPPVLQGACRLAVRYRVHVFDTLYHAVALEIQDGVLITADATYHRVTRATGRIRLLENWREAAS
jgi:predicted nucleic acid-binding protein